MKKRIDIKFTLNLFVLVIMMMQTIRLLPFKSFYNVFPYIVVGIFAVLFIKDFFGERVMWKGYMIIWLLLFMGGYFISTCINYRYALIDNLQLLFWMAFQIFNMYSYDKSISKEEHIRKIEIVQKVFLTFTFIAALLSFGTFIFNINGIMDYGYIEFRYGFRNNRLFGVHGSPNYGALFSVISILISLNFLRNKKLSSVQKILLIVNLLIEYIYIVLSGSRTGQLTLFLGVLAWCFGTYQFVQGGNTLKHVLRTLIISIIIPILLMVGYSPVREFSTFLKTSINSKEEILEKEEQEEINNEINESFVRQDISEDMTNQRADIWKEAVNLIWKDNKLFGKTNLGYYQFMKEEYKDSFIVEFEKVSLHNDWVTLLATSGIVGFTFIVCFVIMIVKRCIAYIIKYMNDSAKIQEIWTVVVILFCFGITTMVSDAIFLVFTTESILFWSFLGFVMYIIDLDSKKSYAR